MPTQTFHIPAPSGSIGVVIKDLLGVPVYTATQGNTPFNVILPAGDYTIYTTFDGAENGWCFNVPDCECPILDHIETEMGTGEIFYGYAHFYFDMSGGFGCPFTIAGSVFGDVGAGTPYSVNINSLSDFTGSVGSMYYKTIWIGGFATYLNYNIQIPVSVTGTVPVICDEGTHVIGDTCTDVLFSEPAGYGTPFYMALIGGITPAITIGINSASCSSASCKSFTVNYVQTNPGMVGAPDSGTVVISDICVSAANLIPVSPNTTYPAYAGSIAGPGRPRYSVTVVSCCGVTTVGNTF